jgi:hypothetical protein
MSDTTGNELFEKWWELTHLDTPAVTAKEYAFSAWQKAMSTPANTVEAPKIQHILSRDQRDALVAANAFLSIMQSGDETLFNRLQGVIDEVSDMLYEE